ncbi:hypothetical protein SIN8267_03030 [Sinobacterium norvegicum]|uniref:Divergent polysaccharide deacetylase family protein n=1 Tax=Sinobacterium norvegicum TaxID=1641715 RepID=A0ABN8EN98_9GAMM|nr:divergent polysaccharide deacetylase family protein [Sinobacterium norvegicum]CAH0992892.1 hypothetical protein SIN8267_03030 [Sinobacterium norvegicum]
MTYLRSALLVLILLSHVTAADNSVATAATAQKTFKLVLIIDDLGNNYAQGQRAVELPGLATMAVLPHRPSSKRLARNAFEQGKEVILHAPMSNVHGNNLGAGALTLNMPEQQLLETLRDNIASIPHVVGVNNHMGSELTSDRQAMSLVMAELQTQQLYFVDSRTTIETVAAEQAELLGLPSMERQVFLDHVINTEAIANEFQRWLKLAEKNGVAVAIGHPHEATMSYLEQQLPTLAAAGFELVTPSQLLLSQQTGAEVFEERELASATELPAELPADKKKPQPILELYRSLLKLSSL